MPELQGRVAIVTGSSRGIGRPIALGLLRLVQKNPSEVTGQALLDEDFLRAEGVTDFDG